MTNKGSWNINSRMIITYVSLFLVALAILIIIKHFF